MKQIIKTLVIGLVLAGVVIVFTNLLGRAFDITVCSQDSRTGNIKGEWITVCNNHGIKNQ